MTVPRALTLTFTLAGLMAVQSILGLAVSDQYRDVEWIKATWFGNDWLTLVVAVPLLVLSTTRGQRGSVRAFLLSAGSVGYAVYNYAFCLLGASFNAFFPLSMMQGLATSTGELLIWAPLFAVTLAVTALLISSVRTQRAGA